MKIYQIKGIARKGSISDSFNVLVGTKNKLEAEKLIRKKYSCGWDTSFEIKRIINTNTLIHIEGIEVLSK